MKNDLLKLGFSDNEAACYLALLELGPCGAGEIIKSTGLHRNLVYEAFERLVSRHLVSKFTTSKIAQFQVASANRLIEAAKAQEEVAQAKVELAIRTAERLSKTIDTRQEIAHWQGDEGFRNFHLQLLDRMHIGDTICVLGSNGEEWYHIMHSEYARYRRKLAKRKISLKMVAFRDYPKNADLAASNPNIEIRIIPTGFEAPANVNIWGDTVFLQIITGQPGIVEMRSKELAEAYMNYFTLLWNQANNT